MYSHMPCAKNFSSVYVQVSAFHKMKSKTFKTKKMWSLRINLTLMLTFKSNFMLLMS